MKKEHYLKIAKEFNQKKTKELAKEIGYSTGAINTAVQKMRDAGYDIPKKNRGGAKDEFEEAFKELKND